MIYHNNKEEVPDRERRVFQPVCGYGANFISLDLRDFQDLRELTPEELHQWFGQTQTRLLPERT